MNKLIYCITSALKWEHAKKTGEYLDESLSTEGFIHCSYANQLLRVANKHFKGTDSLLALCINRNQLTCNIVDEGSNELYPHIYGPINIDAIVDVLELRSSVSGNFRSPFE